MSFRSCTPLLLVLGFAIAACVGDGATLSGPASNDSGAGDDAAAVQDSGSLGTDASIDSGSDAGSDGDAEATADGEGGTFSPKDLPGLALWLDSGAGVTYASAKVTSWLDQSGNGNNATVPSGSCLAPAQAANSLNGKDTLAFTDPGGVGGAGAGTCVSIADSASLRFGTGDFAIFVVARYTNIPGFGTNDSVATFWSKRQPSGSLGGAALFANTFSEAKLQLWQQNVNGNQAVGSTGSLNQNVFHRFGGTRRGLKLETWVDGSSDGLTTLPAADDVSQVGRSLFIGGAPELPQGWLLGNIAEVVAVKGNLTGAQITQLDAYFKAKHAL